MADHGYKCYVPGCAGDVSTFHTLPTELNCQREWLMFIYNRIPQQFNYKLLVCSAHFTTDSFSNLGQYEAGFAQRLLLKKGAIPTILPLQPQPRAAQFDAGFADRLRLKDGAVPAIKDPGHESQPQAANCIKCLCFVGSRRSTSSVPTSQDMPSVKHMECPTKHRATVSAEMQAYPLKTSVGIQCTFAPSQKTAAAQFSFTKQTGHVRSRAMKASTSGLGATPAKRPRMELLDGDEGNLSEIPQPHDSTYEPGDSVADPSEISGMEVSCDYTDAKYIVFESSLRELFETCPLCKRNCDVQRRRLGTFVSFSQVCNHCQYTKTWQSQPVRGSTPVGNLQMSAAVYFTGGSFIQMDKICRAMNLQIHRYNTFRRHARLFLEPSIYHKWKVDQQAMFQQLQPQGKIAVSGDMRTDSPGHSAKYGSYTLTHLESNKILDVQLVQSNEVGGSAHMEKEGLRRGLDLLESNQLHVDYIVTDRHTQVQKYLRERDVKQYYGVWHLEKGLSKKLEKLSRNKDCQVLRKWLPSIKNHIYWSSKEGPEKVAKWKSLVNHIQNVHTHDDPLFPKCAHPDRVSRDSSKWLKPGSMVLYKVEKLLLNKRVLRDVEKLSHQHQTSALEAFHSLILRFAPKNVVFPFIGMLCRLYLAAMHFNENADLEQAMTFEGTAVQKPVKTEPTSGYVSDLMRLLFMEVFDDPATFVEELRKVPIPVDLSAQFDRPAKEVQASCV